MECKNGMLTGCFSVPFHHDKGDGDFGITTCCSIGAETPSGSCFVLPDYGISIPVDEGYHWCFLGGTVLHGTTPSRNFDHVKKIFKKHDSLYCQRNPLTLAVVKKYVNIAWGSAGVTTGPITVPLVLAMGLGFGNAVGAVEGFGILSMASIGPILSVMATGLWVQFRDKRQAKADAAEWANNEQQA